jgi:twinkle protein
VLLQAGHDLAALLTPQPDDWLVTADSLRKRLNVLWAAGLVRGASTGWECIDELYTDAPGLLTVVTGWPNCGKSEWVDALALNLVREESLSPAELAELKEAIRRLETGEGRHD